jgi:hypothetical protein
MPELTNQRSRPPNSVSHPCDAGSMAHATVRACSECRRDDPRGRTVAKISDTDAIWACHSGEPIAREERYAPAIVRSLTTNPYSS